MDDRASTPRAVLPAVLAVLTVALTSLQAACGGPLEEERYREIGTLFVDQTGSFGSVFEDIGDHRLEIRFAFGAGCCDSRNEVETVVEGRSVTITPYFSDIVTCGEDCQEIVIHHDTIAFEAGGSVTVGIVENAAGELALDTTIVLQ